MGRAEHDKIFVRDYDLNKDLLGKISFAQMVYLMLEGRCDARAGAHDRQHVDRPGRSRHDHRRRRGTYDFSFRAGRIQSAVRAAILGPAAFISARRNTARKC